VELDLIICAPFEIEGREDVELRCTVLFTNVQREVTFRKVRYVEYSYDDVWIKVRIEESDRLIAQLWPGSPTINSRLVFQLLDAYQIDWFTEGTAELEKERKR
jgi:hypothetical protein